MNVLPREQLDEIVTTPQKCGSQEGNRTPEIMEMKISINQTQSSMETLIDKLDHKEDRILWLEHTDSREI